MVSYFHFHKMMTIQSFTGDFDQFVHHFMASECNNTSDRTTQLFFYFWNKFGESIYVIQTIYI